ncbi:MAG: acyltransferase [Variovorax sp.]
MQFEKWSGLAGLRFLLAFIVVVTHLAAYTPLGAWGVVPSFGSFEAILGFLLISGYSIGASYAKEPQGFLVRRAKRIYPVYLASLALSYIVYVLANSAHPTWWVTLSNVLFLNQILTQNSLVSSAWSLALEFWLYGLTPWLLRTDGPTLRRLMFASFGAYLLYTCGRTLLQWDYYADVGYGGNLLFLSFAYLAGLRLAREPQAARSVLRDIAIMFTLHIGLATAIQFASSWRHGIASDFLRDGIDAYMLQACTLALVLWAFRAITTRPVNNVPASRLLRLMGDISFPLYLIHLPLYYLLDRGGFDSATFFLGSAVAASFVLYMAVDKYSQMRHLAPSAEPSSLAPRAAHGSPRAFTT